MQREQEKRSRARAKQEKRFARKDEQPDSESEDAEMVAAEDQASVLDALARLHEDFAEGRISFDTFEERQEQLRSSIRVD
jgi:hypothetical protein